MAATKSKPVFTYFNGRGLGEFPRLVMVEAGVEFDDVRKEDIKSLKAGLPFGQVPFYQDGDYAISQSHAIARYIAQEHNLRGSNNKVAGMADMIIEGVRDVQMKYHAFRFEKEEKDKAACKEKFGKETLPEWLVYFEALLTKNGDYYCKEFTFADIFAYYVFNNFNEEFPKAFANAPKVLNHIQTIGKRAKIAAWVASRPKTAF